MQEIAYKYIETERQTGVTCHYSEVLFDDGDYDGACEASSQLFQDEYGDSELSYNDAMFDIVAIPDDCAELSGLGYEPRLGGSCAQDYCRTHVSLGHKRNGDPVAVRYNERDDEAVTRRRK